MKGPLDASSSASSSPVPRSGSVRGAAGAGGALLGTPGWAAGAAVPPGAAGAVAAGGVGEAGAVFACPYADPADRTAEISTAACAMKGAVLTPIPDSVH